MRQKVATFRFLFTTLASNDLVLLARTLPIAAVLTRHGHRVAFCDPAPAPSKLIAAAGFENLLPNHPLAYLSRLQARGKLNRESLQELSRSGYLKREFGDLMNFLRSLLQMTSCKLTPMSSDVWSVDHLYVG
jgi:hypothetical protein